jgi:putative SOS response-associated peptidase YedK
MGEALTRHLDDGRIISFGNNPIADLSDIHQRMPFILRTAAQLSAITWRFRTTSISDVPE